MRTNEITLPGSARSTAPLRPCQGRCAGAERTPDGGLQLTPTRWVCVTCSSRMLRGLR